MIGWWSGGGGGGEGGGGEGGGGGGCKKIRPRASTERIRRRGNLDHAFMHHCKILPHLWAQLRSLDPVGASNAFLRNSANTGPRNSIQLSNQCAMGWTKKKSKISYNMPWNQRVREQWGLSGLISAIRRGLGAWPGVCVRGGGGGGYFCTSSPGWALGWFE